MKKTTATLRPVLSTALLISSLALLPNCDWFKQSDCPSCTHTASPSGSSACTAPEDVLLTIDGQPFITKQKFDDFYDMAVSGDPQSAFAPGISQKIYTYLEQAALMDASIKKSKKDQDPEYRKKIEQAFELARIPVNAEVFQKEILDSVDVSDAALETFYKEQVNENPAFNNPPFITKSGGIKIQAVEFNDDKSASDFLAKAQKPGADFAALAKADKKEVKDLGTVSAQSKVDRAIASKAKDLQQGSIDKVMLSNGKFMVIKGAGAREAAEHISFADIAADENLKNYLKQIKQSTELQSLMMKRFEDLKKELNVQSNTKYAEEKDAKQNAEIQALLESMRAPREQKAKADQSKEQVNGSVTEKAESAKSM